MDLTRGESGSRGTPAARERRRRRGRARILGVAHRESLGLPDARLAPTTEQKDTVVEALRRLRPRVVHRCSTGSSAIPTTPRPAASSTTPASWPACANYRPELGAAFRPLKLAYAPSMTEAAEVAAHASWSTSPRPGTRRCRPSAPSPASSRRRRARPSRCPSTASRHAVELTARRHGPAHRRRLRRGLRHARAAAGGRPGLPPRPVDLTLFPGTPRGKHALQDEQRHHGRGDRRVRDVEVRPLDAAPVDVDEVHHRSVRGSGR